MPTKSRVETDLIFAEESVLDLPEFREVLERYGTICRICDYQTFRMQNLRQEKKCIIFAGKRGAWIKPFHCYENPGYRFYSLDAAEGCSFDCVYCYLQSYLNHGALVCFLGYERLQNELSSLSGDRLWISTGLLTDSLLAERAFPVTDRISKALPPGAILELRTKSAEVNSLQNSAIRRDQVVISWSTNPEKIVSRYELGAPSLASRLKAAKEAVAMGYRVAFHLDPVFYYDGWKAEYEILFRELHKFRTGDIAFLSLGLFRYMPELGSVIRRRFPFHPILASEYFPDRDGKYHYLRAIRKDMYRSFSEWLRGWGRNSIPVFHAMEPDSRLVAEF